MFDKMALISVVIGVLCVDGIWAQQRYFNEPDTTACCEEYCYGHDYNPYIYFASKTAYEFVHGKNSRQHIVPHCQPVQFWSVNRHGARLPGAVSIEELSTQLPKLKREIVNNYEIRKSYPDRGRLCQTDLDNIKEWNWNGNITKEHRKYLTDQGKDDIKYIAKRYQTRFPYLLGIPYNERDFHFFYSPQERIESSYRAFVNGLFGGNDYLVRRTEGLQNQTLAPNEECESRKKYLESLDADESSTNQVLKLQQSTEYQQMVQNVSIRLGFKYTLNVSSIQLMYEMCRMDKSWNVKVPSPWCGAFTKEQLQLLEYERDVESYYDSGYGYPDAAKLGCSYVKELLRYFEQVAKDEPNIPKTIAYFTDTDMFQLLLTALDFQKDSYPLEANNYRLANKRQWRTSKISPYAANLAVVFYKCQEGEKNVMFFLNESPVEYEGCKVGLCSWDSVYSRLKPLADECSLDFCSTAGSSQTVVSMKLISILFIIAVIRFTSKY